MNSKLISIHTIYQILDNTISSRFMCKTVKVKLNIIIILEISIKNKLIQHRNGRKEA